MRGLLIASLFAIAPSSCMERVTELPSKNGLPPQVQLAFSPTGQVTSEFIQVIDGCVFGSDLIGTEVCGLFSPTPGADARITGGDPVLAEWPETWILVDATWSSAALSVSGQLIVTPASSYTLQSGVGPIVTDPGYSAHVLRLDVDNLGPANFDILLTFSTPPNPEVCVKGVDVITVDVLPVGTGTQLLIPTEGLDFTQVTDALHRICISTVSVEEGWWGEFKMLFR